jgi:hypothetical protein
VALTEGEQLDAAIEHYRGLLASDPADFESLHRLGTIYLLKCELPAAREYFDRALQIESDHVEAHHNRAGALLLAGNLVEGLPDYEWRHRLRDYPRVAYPWKEWSGEPLAGRTIVLWAEQGFGDTLQFIRYAPLVKQQAARVAVMCSTTLRPLLTRTPGVDALLTPEGELIEADFCLPMMSLPYRLGTTLETIPAQVPYLFTDPKLVDHWRQRLGRWDGFTVGINWQGSPRLRADRKRSIPLIHYEPLAKVPGLRLFNLQKGPGLEQLTAVGQSWSVIDFGDEVDRSAGAFMDTAAIMQSLDLVITSDTVTAHLAGALGVPVWVALQLVPEWRWLLEREDSPWYPTMRLFRQQRAGDWPEVFQRMAGELARLSEDRRR